MKPAKDTSGLESFIVLRNLADNSGFYQLDDDELKYVVEWMDSKIKGYQKIRGQYEQQVQSRGERD